MFWEEDTETHFKSVVKNSMNNVHKVKFISPTKWRRIMLGWLQNVISEHKPQQMLAQDILMVVSKIPEQYLIQSALQIKPFRPTFQENPLFRSTLTSSSDSEFQKLTLSKQQIKATANLYCKQQTLGKTFSHKHHPFFFIIDGFCLIIEKKYQLLGKKLSLEQVQKQLDIDIRFLLMFLTISSEPYLKIFKSQTQIEMKSFKVLLNKYLHDYLRGNEKIMKSVVKIVRFCLKTDIENIISKMPIEIPEIQNFMIPHEFQIDGCYIGAINTLLQFCEIKKGNLAIAKLIEFRVKIREDIDAFHQLLEQQNYRELTAQIQIEVIRYIICKLKEWMLPLYSQLKALEVLFGEDDIASKYQDASYMYTQLSIAFEAVMNF